MTVDVFVKTLQADQVATDALRKALCEERSALLSHDATALQAALYPKIEHLQTLEQNRATRTSLLKAEGFVYDKAGVSTYLRRHVPSTQVKQIVDDWMALKALIDQCLVENKKNGMIISANVEAVRRLEACFYGKSDTVAEVYSQSGKHKVSYYNDRFDRA